MAELGEFIKNRRLARNWSLRRLGGEIGVTPAYVADIEANRRLPSADLRQRISSVLEIPPEELEAADNRLSPNLREWIEERPHLITLLRSLRASPESDMLIQRLTKFLNRRSPPKIPRGFLVTWESELRAIAAEASAWSIETGGDLFGRWHDIPTILLATKAGPNAQRNNAHFRLDVDYLRQFSETLASDWALRYFGDWHSHHRLGLSAPSGGDRKRILSIAGRNQFTGMAEIIVTLEDTRGEPTIRIHPWLYDLSSQNSGPLPLRVKVSPGLSPVRQALLARRVLPEQEFFAWEKISLQRIRIGSDAAPPNLEPASDVDATTRERTLSQLAEALQNESGSAVEHHTTGFGCVVVANLEEQNYLAFALGTAWPMTVLEVHRLNRDAGTAELIKTPGGLVAPDIPGILEIFRAAKANEKRSSHVDS
ncbi:MAG: helix-turn-helix domain-containing protein [Acidobacteriia bacterium]|nr:helix-turn-helix domain-containing protein [Terriglobia bacterium]